MSELPVDWRREAFDAYRLGRLELERWKGEQPADLAYFVEDLHEALLDLKQATMSNLPKEAEAFTGEVYLLMTELRHRRGD